MMEVKVNIGGVEATVIVKDASEAAQLLSSIANTKRQKPEMKVDDIFERHDEQTEDTPQIKDTAGANEIREAISDLKGMKSARLLWAIANAPDGCNDRDAKKLAGFDADQNLGPLFSSISKTCKRSGFSTDAIYSRYTKRRPRGKVLYFYRITDKAREAIQSIEDFEKEEEFPGY